MFIERLPSDFLLSGNASPSPVSSMARRDPSFPVAWVAISSSHLHPTSPCPDSSCMPTSACLRRMANCSKLPLPLRWDSAPSSYRAQVKQCFRRETNTSLIQQVLLICSNRSLATKVICLIPGVGEHKLYSTEMERKKAFQTQHTASGKVWSFIHSFNKY